MPSRLILKNECHLLIYAGNEYGLIFSNLVLVVTLFRIKQHLKNA